MVDSDHTDGASEDRAAVERRITEQLRPLATPIQVGDRLLPPPDYVRRHLAEHAAAGRVLDERLLTPTFLPYVDVARLRGLARDARMPELQLAGWLTAWRQVAHRWRWEAPAANRAALEVAAAALGVPADQRGLGPSQTAWRVRWAAWPLLGGGEVIAVHEHPVAAVALASFEGRLVLATGSWDTTARLWDATTGEPLGPPLRHGSFVGAVGLTSLDGRLVLATGSYDTVRLWDPTTGQPLGPPLTHDDRVEAVALAILDNQLVLAAGSKETARVWDPTTAQPLGRPLRLHDRVGTVALATHDGRLVLATGSNDGTARLWDPTTGQPLGPPLRHDHRVEAVALATLDNQVVLATSSRDTAWLWDPVNARQLVEPLPLPGAVSGIAAIPSSHGLAVAIGGGAGVVVAEIVGNR